MKKMEGVEDTLFIPFEARIFSSKYFPQYFYDEKALELEQYVPKNDILKKSSEYTLMASVARYYNMDEMVLSFLKKHDKGNIVYLGAGLETAYYRIDNITANFYEVDLPDVIEQRKKVLPNQENEKMIAGDLFELEWTKEVDVTLPTLIVVSGVFQYFKEDKIKELINNLKTIFDYAELIFDATNETGIKYANKYVQKTGNKDAMMYFYVNDSKEFAKETDTTLIEERLFFEDARKLGRKLKLYTRISMFVVDKTKRAIIVHIKL